MSELEYSHMTTEVELQENGIVRDKNGTIIGRLVKDVDELCEYHYTKGFNEGYKKAKRGE